MPLDWNDSIDAHMAAWLGEGPDDPRPEDEDREAGLHLSDILKVLKAEREPAKFRNDEGAWEPKDLWRLAGDCAGTRFAPEDTQEEAMSLDVTLIAVRPVEVFESNVTHNLIPMATEAGLYEWLWRPETKGVQVARDLIAPLETGLAALKADRARFTPLNPMNGWGTYDYFVSFVEGYLQACRNDPEAGVHVSR